MTTRFPADWVPPSSRSHAGLFRADQAAAAGMTAAQVRRRRDAGRWVTVVGDALALRTQPVDAWQLAHGAWLTWPDSVVCLGTAARLHRLPVDDDGRVHVLVPHPRATRGRLTPHEFRVEPREITRVGHTYVTDLRRTIFDCLGRLDDRQSEQLMIWAVTRELLSRADLELAVASRPGRWGNTRRRRVLDDTRTGALGAGERRLHTILSQARITGWLPDQRVFDDVGLVGRADVLFPAVRLVIEIDGLAYHGAASFQSDRTRQNRLVNAGYTVLRFTWQDLTDRPAEVARQIRTALTRLAGPVSRGFGPADSGCGRNTGWLIR